MQTISITRDSSGWLKPAIGSRVGASAPNSYSGEIVLLLDWSSVSGTKSDALNPTAVYTGTEEIAAAVLPVLMAPIENLGSKPLVELPIHLIGHSRGGSLVAELARELL